MLRHILLKCSQLNLGVRWTTGIGAWMEFGEQPWQPPASPLRVYFHVEPPPQRGEVEALLRELVAEVPIAPDEGELDPGGEGSLRYGADAELTSGDRDQIIAWMQAHPRLSAVRCVTGWDS